MVEDDLDVAANPSGARSPKKRGLGRGLDALFEDEESGSVVSQLVGGQPAEKGVTSLGVDQLKAGAGQPRRVFKAEALAELADSIKEHGVLQPLLVRKNPDDSGVYEIIAGERRWRAAQKARLHDVPVIFLDLTDVQAYEVALIENLQREDLDPVEEARGFSQLMERYDYTQDKLAKSLGKSRSYIANMTRLLQLPESVLDRLSEGDLSTGHARALIVALDPEALARVVVERGLSVRETEVLVSSSLPFSGGAGASHKKNLKAGGALKTKKKGTSEGKGVDVLALEKHISDLLGMSVSIESPDGVSGIVQVAFSSLDQMDDLLKRLSQSVPSALARDRLRG